MPNLELYTQERCLSTVLWILMVVITIILCTVYFTFKIPFDKKYPVSLARILHSPSLEDKKQKALDSLYNKKLPSIINFDTPSAQYLLEVESTEIPKILRNEKWKTNNKSLQKICLGLISFIHSNNNDSIIISKDYMNTIEQFIIKLDNHINENVLEKANSTYWLYWDYWLYYVSKFLVYYILWSKSDYTYREIAARSLMRLIWFSDFEDSPTVTRTQPQPTYTTSALSKRKGGTVVIGDKCYKKDNILRKKIMVVNSQVSGFPLCTAMVYYLVGLKVLNNLTMDPNEILHSSLNLLISQYYTTQYLLMLPENNNNRVIKLDGGILDGEILKNQYMIQDKELKTESVIVNNYYTYLQYVIANELLLQICPSISNSNIHNTMLDKIQSITKHPTIEYGGTGGLLLYASKNITAKIGTYNKSTYGVQVIPSLKYLRMFDENYSFSIISPILERTDIGIWPYCSDLKKLRDPNKDSNAITTQFGLFQKTLYQKKSNDLDKQEIPLGMLMESGSNMVPIVPNNKLKLSGKSWVFNLTVRNVGIHYSNWVSGDKNYSKYEYTEYVVINHNDKTIMFNIKIINSNENKSLQYHLGADSEPILIQPHKSKMICYSIDYGISSKPKLHEHLDWNSKFNLDGSRFILEVNQDGYTNQEEKVYTVKTETYANTSTMISNNYILMLDGEPLILCPSYKNSQYNTLMSDGVLFKYDQRSNQWLKSL